MAFAPADHFDIFYLGPERFPCVLLRWDGRGKILPIWIDRPEAAKLQALSLGYEPKRPGPHETFAEALTRFGPEIKEVRIVSHHEGVFIAELETSDGQQLDSRPSDAIILAQILGIPVLVDEDVITQAGVYVGDRDLVDLISGKNPPDPKDAGDDVSSASGDEQADRDFEQLMASLGVSEEDLLGAEDSPHSHQGPAGSQPSDTGGADVTDDKEDDNEGI